MNFHLAEDYLRITNKEKNTIIEYSTPIITDIVNSVKELISSLHSNNYDWKNSSNTLVFTIINKTFIFVNKYKKFTIDEKKDFCFKLIEKLIEKEVSDLEISEEQKNLLKLGIDTIIEPLIEMTILTAFKKINYKQSCFSCSKK
tara:strand:+ start:417 stop:848 length:432 start_codon:yes stop_codon:yes gene_type:complete